MTRAVVALAAIFALSHASRARAHGLVPAPQSIIASDGKGVRAVRLTEGLALRTEHGFQYVCPAAWGGTYALVLAAAMSDGTIAVATPAGIAVLSEDGTFAPHPDALASGQVIALTATPTTLYALFRRGSTTELVRIRGNKAHTAYTDSAAWSDVVAGEDQLLLVRFDGVGIQELRLSTSDDPMGAEDSIGGGVATAPDGTAAVFARLAGKTSYVVATVKGGLALDLGRIEDNTFHVLQTAQAGIAGPLDTADGHRFVALDGVLAHFDGEHVDELGDDAIVTFLGRDGSRSYACTRAVIRALDADGLGATLFDITQLQDPNLSIVPEPLRTECSDQWDHFRFDLAASGVTLTSRQDAGVEADAATPDDAGTRERDAGRSSTHRSSGCTIADGGMESVASLALTVLVLVRRRQPRRR